MNILSEKIYFLHSTNFKLLIQMKANSLNNCDFFFKVLISVGGSYCDCLSVTKKPLA